MVFAMTTDKIFMETQVDVTTFPLPISMLTQKKVLTLGDLLGNALKLMRDLVQQKALELTPVTLSSGQLTDEKKFMPNSSQPTKKNGGEFK